MKNKKCKTCFGLGVWSVGDPVGVGPMDAADGVPTNPCPECGAGPPYWKTAEGKIIPITHLEDDHLVNIIQHIKDRQKITKIKETNLLKLMIKEQKRREEDNVIKGITITGTVGGRINTRKWGSKKEDIKNDQHSPKKKWQTHFGLKRTKVRWNKKKGKQEKSKKGSRDRICWAD